MSYVIACSPLLLAHLFKCGHPATVVVHDTWYYSNVAIGVHRHATVICVIMFLSHLIISNLDFMHSIKGTYMYPMGSWVMSKVGMSNQAKKCVTRNIHWESASSPWRYSLWQFVSDCWKAPCPRSNTLSSEWKLRIGWNGTQKSSISYDASTFTTAIEHLIKRRCASHDRANP